MAVIQLTTGGRAYVDDGDYELVSKYLWRLHDGYASTSVNRVEVRMHTVIMGRRDGYGVDHIDGNKRNNRRCNLRWATHLNNTRNQRKRSNNTSGYKGVSWHKGIKKWVAKICVGYKQVSLGAYANAIDAAKAYDEAAKLHFGEYAKTNF